MIAVDDCEADSYGFCLGAFDDWEEFAVAAGAPYDFLGAHCFVSVDVGLTLPSVVRMIGRNLARRQREETGGGGW
jgi:hypothetical protein